MYKLKTAFNIPLSLTVLLISIFLVIGCKSSPVLDVQSMEIKEGWQFCKKGEFHWYKATIPGCVHSDLMNQNLVPDPFYRNNEKTIQWVENEEWKYTTQFFVKKHIKQKRNIKMIFKGLDTHANIYLNNLLILKTNNMFREWEVDIKSILLEGKNQLLIHFLSPVKESFILWNQLDYELPGGPRVMIRKPGYHFGWDWGPRLVTTGIWKPIFLQAWDEIKIESMQIFQNKISEERAHLSALFEIYSENYQKAQISLWNTEKNKILGQLTLDLAPGINRHKLNVEIQNPRLWWIHNMGEPYLYSLKGRVAIKGGLMDEISHKIGIRTLELVQDRDELGESFYFKLNGIPFFAKGANLVPLDCMLNRVSDLKYKTLINSALAANMNMVRVWGGGIYENDIFYDLCDQQGILVWQDFMFACAMYPAGEDFLDNVREEATFNVKRLRHHPSIALWCGNNEISEAWHNWGWQKSYNYTQEQIERIWQDYQKIFHELLPKVVRVHDRERPYWPSSPKFGRGDRKSLFEGDSHFWGVWHDEESFEKYIKNTPRFMSEFGFQSFPSFKTIESFTIPGDQGINSTVMLNRQKHPRGNTLIKRYMEHSYTIPQTFDLFVYTSQLLQAEGLKIGIEAHRRARPYCMGSLYWQLNDCWPAVSWSSIDYYGRWKALHFFVKKAFQDILVSPTIEGGNLKIYVVSDRLKPIEVLLQVQLKDFSGTTLKKLSLESLVEANQSSILWETGAQDLLKDYDRRNLVLEVNLLNNTKKIASNLFYFLQPKDLLLKPPDIKREITPLRDGKIRITISCESLAKNVFLHTKNVEGTFSDNYFDLLPGEPVEIMFACEKNIKNFDRQLKIISLINTL